MRSSIPVTLLLLALVLGLGAPPSVFADDGDTAPPAATPAGPAEEAPEPSPPEPLLWVVEGEPRIFLFGTIHIPDQRVKTFSKTVEDARASADVLWTEIRMEMAEQMKVQMAAMLTGGKTLKDVLPEDLYKRTTEYIASKGYPGAMLDAFKPWVVATTIQILDILPQMAQNPALDATLYDEAKAAGKEVGGLETAEEQIAIFDTMSNEEQAEMLSKTIDLLKEAEKDGGALEMITKAYLTGDPEVIHKAMYDQYDPTDPLQKKLMTALLDDRNVRMVDRMLERSAKAPEKTYFVAVGAAHYPGEMGILKLLEKKGKTVRRLKRGDTIEAPKAEATAAE